VADTTNEDKVLAVDFHFAVCLLAIEELADALSELYASIWLLTGGNDTKANTLYRRNYHSILKAIADESSSLTVTDDFRKQYLEQKHGNC